MSFSLGRMFKELAGGAREPDDGRWGVPTKEGAFRSYPLEFVGRKAVAF